MASNFRLISNRERNCIHFKLNGDFDGSSAFELINALNEESTRYAKIFIDTDNLTIIDTFGKEVFKKNIKTLKNQFHDLVFVGKNKHNLKI